MLPSLLLLSEIVVISLLLLLLVTLLILLVSVTILPIYRRTAIARLALTVASTPTSGSMRSLDFVQMSLLLLYCIFCLELQVDLLAVNFSDISRVSSLTQVVIREKCIFTLLVGY